MKVKGLKEATRLYAASWARAIGPDLRPNHYKKSDDNEEKPTRVNDKTREKELSTLEDLVKEWLGLVDPVFARAADAMVDWIKLWKVAGTHSSPA